MKCEAESHRTRLEREGDEKSGQSQFSLEFPLRAIAVSKGFSVQKRLGRVCLCPGQHC